MTTTRPAQPPTDRARAFERFAWTVLAYGVLVIVWGAVVRATSSGAGCGAHWPLCNGEVVPLAPRAATIIEFAHRATSGLILVLTAALVAWSMRVFGAGHPVRRAAVWSLVFVLIEAAVGAGIVLLELVEGNASALRAGYIGAHLCNTMLLVGAYARTAQAARVRPVSLAAGTAQSLRRAWGLAALALLAVSASGAIVALGDTLFPHASLAEGLAADLDPTAHFLIRLRVWHPVLAGAAAVWLLVIVRRTTATSDPAVAGPARLVLWFTIGQLMLGAINLLLLAPLALQMAHLVVSNLVWIGVVWIWFLCRPEPASAGNRRAG